MSFVTGAAMRSLEEAAFRRGVSAESLMDRAGEGIARRLLDHFPQPGRAVAYIGKGNNGGDALVALRYLREAGWQIALKAAYPETEWGVLPRRKRRELVEELPNALPEGSGPLLLLDGLLGIGARGTLREPLARLAEEMAWLRDSHGAVVAAMDLPSGIDADSGEGRGVVADLTITVGVAKLGLSTPAGIASAGRILLVPLGDLPPPEGSALELFGPDAFPGLLSPRPHDFHKGDSGRIGLLAGSPGMTGAAVLAATAALRAGAGLVTLHVEPEFLPSLAAPMPPEVMVKVSPTPVTDAFSAGHDALVIGPGIANMSKTGQADLLARLAKPHPPAVLDADGLNFLATAGKTALLDSRHLITPHPGEFRRLAPDLAEKDRLAAAVAFVTRHPCTLLLKGARTLVAAPGEATRFNPTGHAGMASGGQGDVLSGVAGAFLAQGMKPCDAASLAAWLCGRAAERALAKGPVTTASDTLDELGGAMRDWQERRR
ncbi:NAD(P)H-hydrate dehydratase [Luteolibacter arcticus]|uniref:Bifunctional NAD(P)H-hydrate repair enzyme n=1 Tax=Luteolibacter arcticus TaxID=1581411 RepID=A0ABT3GFY5_9BACT|nr:NAD(P)H-hydrate dehydratase [Luteolibacter arcticus]MCW1922532.1 NAD(P)H-hydrate dehydratase [Luteolibacter arcticus]